MITTVGGGDVPHTLAPRRDQFSAGDQHSVATKRQLISRRGRAARRPPTRAAFASHAGGRTAVENVPVIARQHDSPPAGSGLVEECPQEFQRLKRPPHGELVGFAKVVIDGIDDHTHHASLR